MLAYKFWIMFIGKYIFFLSECRTKGIDSISFALPKDHLAWDVLRQNHVELLEEPDGVRREIFMVRPAKGQPIDEFASLQWSLADKF